VLLCACGGGQDVEIAAGPWLLHVGGDEATLVWTTSVPADGSVECWTPDANLRARHAPRVTVHELRVVGLRPATRYHYWIRSGGARSPILTFRTTSTEASRFRFAVYGGTAGDPEQHARVARAICREDPAFVVHTGGCASAPGDLAAWRAEFFAPAAELLSSRPIVAAAGLHERDASHFGRLFPTHTGARWRSYRLSYAEVFVLDLAEGISVGSEQYEWLRNALRRSSAWWKFVVCHPPLLSADPGAGHADLRRVLFPVLLRGGVDAVFTGGTIRERTVRIGLGAEPGGSALVCFSTVAAGPLGQPRPMPWTAGASADHHFLLVEVDAEKVTVTARDAGGREFDRAVLRKPDAEGARPAALPAEALEAFLAFAPTSGFDLGELGPAAVKKTFAASVVNPYDTPIEGELKWRVEEGAGWTVEPAVLKVRIPPLGAQKLTFTVTVQPGKVGPAPTFSLVAAGRELKARHSPLRIRVEENE
jgi:hypothetical protein